MLTVDVVYWMLDEVVGLGLAGEEGSDDGVIIATAGED